LAGKHLPPLELGIKMEYQFCVDAGVAAATDFFCSLSDFSLHNHIAVAAQSFCTSVGAGLAAAGCYEPATMQASMDAFAAGYLGRIQQELRLFHGEGVTRL
jgi:hypothetical protein